MANKQRGVPEEYRRARKPVPRPGRPMPDRRRRIAEDLRKREIEEEERRR